MPINIDLNSSERSAIFGIPNNKLTHFFWFMKRKEEWRCPLCGKSGVFIFQNDNILTMKCIPCDLVD